MVVTADAFNLYVLLEISSLSGYALLARGGDRAPLAVLNYVLLGTIGASFYLLGVGFLYIKTGTLNMSDLAVRMTPLYESPAISAAFLLILVGLWLKSAFFPLHLWLPQAYTHGNTAAVGLFAPLMTKVMIFIMIRFMVTVFTPYFAFVSLDLADLIVWLATAAVVAGALLALAQKDFKKMLSYVIVTEVGYMIGGAWLGNRAGMTGAVLHVLFDALMTLCVFLAVAAISYRIKSMRIQDFQGLFGRMPLTMSGLAVGALSIIGVPPACGFWSKWYLVSGAIQAGHWPFAVVLLFSSLVAVVLFFRVFEIAFFEPANAGGHGHGHGPVRRREAPWSMILPLWVTAGALIAAGFLTGPLVRTFVEPAIGSPL
jgi:multicomponent Na+:H+ antiporter subunit D